jgi:hypothetical protein
MVTSQNDNGWTRTATALIRTDALGQPVWQRYYGWAGALGAEGVTHITPSSRTGRILLSGWLYPGSSLPFVLKLLLVNQWGDSIRGRQLAPWGSARSVRVQDNFYNGVLPMRDGGFVLTGYVDSVTTAIHARPPFVLRVDSLLRLRWAYALPLVPREQVVYGHACELADSSVLVLAHARDPVGNTFWLHHFARTGQRLGSYPFTSSCGQVQPFFLVPMSDGHTVYVAGQCYGVNGPAGGTGYIAVVDLQSLPGTVLVTATAAPGPRQPVEARLTAYPNPASTAVTVDYRLPAGSQQAVLVVRDAVGRIVQQVGLPANQGTATVPVHTLPNGLYVYALVVEGRIVLTHKLAVLR